MLDLPERVATMLNLRDGIEGADLREEYEIFSGERGNACGKIFDGIERAA